MRTIFLSLLLAQSVFGVTCPANWANGYSKCFVLTVDPTKVQNTDQTNYTTTACFNGSGVCSESHPEFKVTGSGGSVTSVVSGVPTDVIVTSDSAGVVLDSWAVDVYNSTTGEIVFKVKRTVSHTVGTVFYFWIGKSSATTFQGGSVGSAYDSGFCFGYGFGDSSTLSLADLSSAGLTLTNTSSVAGAGQIGGGIVTTSTHFANTTSSICSLPSGWTLVGWLKTSTTTEHVIVKVSTDTGAGQEYLICNAAGKVQVGDSGGGSGRAIGTSTTCHDNNWHMVVGTFDAGGFHAYYDGALEATQAASKVNTANGIWISRQSDGTSPLTGTVDEVQGWSSAQTADWVKTIFNNQSSPSTFYSTTAAVSPSGGIHHKVITGKLEYPIPHAKLYEISF